MSKLLSFTTTGTFGMVGFRMGGVTLSAGTANAAVILLDGARQTLALTAPANTSVNSDITDINGAVFEAQPSISVLSGAGASINIEEI